MITAKFDYTAPLARRGGYPLWPAGENASVIAGGQSPAAALPAAFSYPGPRRRRRAL